MNEEIERIEMTIEQAQAKVEKAEKFTKLLANPLFKELITDDYLGDDAVRITIGLKPGGDNAVAMSFLEAKANFSRYVGNVLNEGAMAAESIDEHKDLMAELKA